MENERKDKRHEALEAEKDHLKQDLNELDQLKDLLIHMQTAQAEGADASRLGSHVTTYSKSPGDSQQNFYGPIRTDKSLKRTSTEKSLPA